MNEELRILLVDYRNADSFLCQCLDEGQAAVETGAMCDAMQWKAQASFALRNALHDHPEWLAERQEFEE